MKILNYKQKNKIIKFVRWLIRHPEPKMPIFREQTVKIETAVSKITIDEREFEKRNIETTEMVKRQLCNQLTKYLIQVNAVEITPEKEHPGYPMVHGPEMVTMIGKLNYVMPFKTDFD